MGWVLLSNQLLKRPGLVAIVLVMAISFWGHVVAFAAEAQQDLGFDPALFHISPNEISTDIVGLLLQGQSFRDKLSILDFDIIIDNEDRMIPLLRILRILQAKRNKDKAIFQFSIAKKKQHVFIVQDNQLTVLPSNISYEITSGISDVTGNGELYVDEKILVDLFGMDYRWNDSEYAYEVTTHKNMYIFERDKKTLLGANIRQILDELPQTESTRYPGEARTLLSFIEVDGIIKNSITQNGFSSIVQPNIRLYGNLLGGNYQLRLSENIDISQKNIPNASSWLKAGLWVAKSDYINVRIGDTSLGIDQLIAPTASFSGVVARGFVGAGTQKNRDQFLKNSQFNFVSESIFTGYDDLGSTVELIVNNQVVATQEIEEIADASPGQGRYAFSGVGLASRSVNEVIIRITRPDGSVSEKIETILGSSNLLPKDQGAYSVGVGTKRREQGGKIGTEGIYAGLGYYYGLSRFATLGMLVAFQDEFFTDNSVLQLGNNKLSRRLFLGEKLTLKLLDNLNVTVGMAANYVTGSSKKPQAKDVEVNYGFSTAGLSAYVFSYDEGYTNGSANIGDRRGYTLSMRWKPTTKWSIDNVFANLSTLDRSIREQYIAASLTLPTLPLWRTELRLRFDGIKRDNNAELIASTNRMLSVSQKSQLLRNLVYRATYSWGDEISLSNSQGSDTRSVNENGLISGLRVPLLGSLASFGLTMEGRLGLNQSNAVSIVYRDSRVATKSVGITYNYGQRKRNHINLIAKYRHDLLASTNRTEFNLEYPLDERRKNTLSGGITFDDSGQLSAKLSVKAYGLLHRNRNELRLLPKLTRVNPVSGGVSGRVYLDINGNGHFEQDEPGVADIDILVDGYKRMISDDEGYFYVARNSFRDEVFVSVDLNKLPAIYTPTQGIQHAKWDEYVFTRVNLGIAVLGSISGRITTYQLGHMPRELPGAIVFLTKDDDPSYRKQSVTDFEGYYYFGELHPGGYTIDIDPSSYPDIYQPVGEKMEISIRALREPDDIENININLEAN